MTDGPAGEARDKGPLLLLSQRYAAWLAAADVCIALTTYWCPDSEVRIIVRRTRLRTSESKGH